MTSLRDGITPRMTGGWARMIEIRDKVQDSRRSMRSGWFDIDAVLIHVSLAGRHGRAKDF